MTQRAPLQLPQDSSYSFFFLNFFFICLFVFVFVLLGFFRLVWGLSFKSGFDMENRLQGQKKGNGEVRGT